MLAGPAAKTAIVSGVRPRTDKPTETQRLLMRFKIEFDLIFRQATRLLKAPVEQGPRVVMSLMRTAHFYRRCF